MKLKITVHGVAYEVGVEVLDAGEGFPTGGPLPLPQNGHARPGPTAAAAPVQRPVAPAPAASNGGSGDGLIAPIAGVVLEILCKVGDSVKDGDEVLVLEAMKMKTRINATQAGKVKAIKVAAGDTVRESQLLVEFE